MSSESDTLRRAMVAALRRLEAGGLPNTTEAMRLLREGLATPQEYTGLEYRAG